MADPLHPSPPSCADGFRQLMRPHLRERRLYDGARRWRLYQDAKNPERFLELYCLDSWGEHLLQHQRTTMDDREIEGDIPALHKGPDRPIVSHYFGAKE